MHDQFWNILVPSQKDFFAFGGPGWGGGVGTGSDRGQDYEKCQVLDAKSPTKVSQLSW